MNASGAGVSATIARTIPNETNKKKIAQSEYAKRGFKKAKALQSAISIKTKTIGSQLNEKIDRTPTPPTNPETIAISALMSEIALIQNV